MKFKEWFDKKLTIGSFPIMNNENFNSKDYDVIINVSDEYYLTIVGDLKHQNNLCDTHWFPMNEVKKDIGLNSIYGAMVVLYAAEQGGEKVYLHCHAGVNRSRSVQAAYYFMRTGEHLEVNTNGYINRLVAICHRGYLPPKKEMEKFLNTLSHKLKDNLKIGGVLDTCKIEAINNF